MKRHLLPFLLLIGSIALTACQPTTGNNSGEEDTDSIPVSPDSTAAQDTTPGIVRIDSSEGDNAGRKYIEGNFTVPAAMEVVYGLYDKNFECSKWVCKPHEARTFGSKAAGDGTIHTRPAGVYPFETSEGRKMLLLTETLSREKDDWEDCHVCAPILGAVQFQEIDGAWFIESLRKDLGELGSWGQLPANKLVKLGPDEYGVLFNYGYTAQGITEGGIRLIGPIEGQFEALLDLNTSFSNEASFADPKNEEGAYSYNSEINFEDETPGAPYTISITRHGTRPVDGLDGDGPIEKFSEKLKFVRKGNKYVEVEGN
ncbi:MAG: hypothetical protein U0176_12395 [Bacteroidia bacterium]